MRSTIPCFVLTRIASLTNFALPHRTTSTVHLIRVVKLLLVNQFISNQTIKHLANLNQLYLTGRGLIMERKYNHYIGNSIVFPDCEEPISNNIPNNFCLSAGHLINPIQTSQFNSNFVTKLIKWGECFCLTKQGTQRFTTN